MLNIVVPMAGSGSRFAQAGYVEPKPLIPVFGMPMVELVIRNLRPSRPHRFIFICQQAHLDEFGLAEKLKAWAGPETLVRTVPGLTEGAACTVLSVRDVIDSADALMIANCDQYFDARIDDFLADADSRGLDGSIMTLTASDPKWSFAAVDSAGMVTEVAEKKPISPHATVGVYAYGAGADFVRGADAMIAKNLRVNNEFYVAPVYNEIITSGKRIGIYNIGSEMNGMYGLGTPQDLEAFLKLGSIPNPNCRG